MLSKRWALASATLLTASLAACGTSTPAGGGSSTSSANPSAASGAKVSSFEVAGIDQKALTKGDGTKTVYLVSKGFQHRFWQAVKEGAEKAGADYGYKVVFVGPDNETQVTQQNNQLQTALDSHPAAIGFAALDTKAATSILDKVKAAKIPLVAFDSGVEGDYPLTTVATDNTAAAGEAGKHMAELVNNTGKVGIICHDNTSTTGKQRCQGFQDYIKASAPGINLLTPQVAGEVALAANTAKSMLQANPDLVGIYGTNEAAATGAVQGVTELNKSSVKVVGFDSGKTQLAAIRNGKAAGAITQSPVKMGYATVVAAIAAEQGKTLPAKIDSGFAWYDKANMENADIKANLYE